MRVMLTSSGMWGSHGPKMGDVGEAFYFTQNDKGQVVFLVRFPGFTEYHACTPGMVCSLVGEVMSDSNT